MEGGREGRCKEEKGQIYETGVEAFLFWGMVVRACVLEESGNPHHIWVGGHTRDWIMDKQEEV